MDFEAEQQDCWQQLPFATVEEAEEYFMQQQLQQGTSTEFEYTVPEGAKPGDQLSVKTPAGEISFTLPEGALPGTVLAFDIGPPPDDATG